MVRGQYPVKTLSDEQIEHATEYFGSDDLREDVDEVLITGGDPLMSIKKLRISLENIKNAKILK